MLRLPSVDLDQFVHDCLVLPLDCEDALLPLKLFKPVNVRLGGLVGLVRRHAGFGVGELLHVQLVLPQLLVVVEGVVAHPCQNYYNYRKGRGEVTELVDLSAFVMPSFIFLSSTILSTTSILYFLFASR